MYLYAWLLLLRIDEVLRLKFESLNIVHPTAPKRRKLPTAFAYYLLLILV